ncbi:MAG: DNA helicase RecQ [Neomegalonema sp.]|nr:DNA helicase RecQ [Neomegalonema sp.]
MSSNDSAPAQLCAAESGDGDALATLRRVWGYESFRAGQEEIVRAVLAGDDALAIMPTGGGKSLCYQLPALLRPGLALVVSPLIALMQDQVAALQALGVEAGALTSANSFEENTEIRAKLRAGSLKLLYVAPERLAQPDTAYMLARKGVSLLAVDEAHCVAQWGHDFRPDYLAVGAFRARMEQEQGERLQVAAFTATADEATRAEIIDKLFTPQRPPRAFIRGFDRPNLRLAFEPKANTTARIVDFVKERQGQAGIIYCSSRKRAEKVAERLNAEGVRALAYHAGLPSEQRAQNQRAFVHEDGVVMAATVAFGMGVDKPDVRYVVHADLPKTVESYYQEIGRAGRDGAPADTLTLFGVEDIKLRWRQIEESDAPEQRKRSDRGRLQSLLALAEAPTCRRQTLLAYFGETLPEPCGGCDLCQEPQERYDGSIIAQKALSAIRRTGERFGVEHLIAVLRGDPNEAVVRHEHDKLPTFGVGADLQKHEWRSVFRQIYATGLAAVDLADFGGWRVTEAGWEAMRGEREVFLRKDSKTQQSTRRERTRGGPMLAADADPDLYRALKLKRMELAQEHNVPAYVIFTDRTLAEIASVRPQDEDALSRCHGVGEAKLKRFGRIVLDIVAREAAA